MLLLHYYLVNSIENIKFMMFCTLKLIKCGKLLNRTIQTTFLITFLLIYHVKYSGLYFELIWSQNHSVNFKTKLVYSIDKLLSSSSFFWKHLIKSLVLLCFLLEFYFQCFTFFSLLFFIFRFGSQSSFQSGKITLIIDFSVTVNFSMVIFRLRLSFC